MNSAAGATRDVLAAIRQARMVLDAINLMDPLMSAAADDGAAAAAVSAEALADDDVTAIAAAHAAAMTGATTARQLLVPLLTGSSDHLREHAAWALAGTSPLPEAVPTLQDMAHAGGFTGTMAEATLETWGALTDPEDDADIDDGDEARANPLGLTVAQLYLHADIDGTLSHAGQGDTGGIATLLVHLGDALAAEEPVSRVLTLSRGRAGRLPGRSVPAGAGHHYLAVPLPGPVRHAPDAWPLRLDVRRGVRRLLRAAGRVDVLHLRMADVGAWAAAEVARDLGIPTVLTLAPDPHALIAARESAGTLTRTTFGAADHAEHLIFRIRLLRQLAQQAAHLVVFPRPHLERDLRELLHLAPDDRPRVTAVPEGINLAPLDRARLELPSAVRGDPVSASTTTALGDLVAVLERLPVERRTLPLAITVGRLHRVKGMATLVRAWAADPALARRCNLLVVGGDLHDPSPEEAEQLRDIDATIPRASAPDRGLLLAGHRPNGTVAVWLAATLRGLPGLAAPAGVYVSASLKEEFGIAILEAMASGLVVVAPNNGGPATYVEHRITGILADTGSPTSLGNALGDALDLAAAPEAERHAENARDLVRRRFSIETMASALARIYGKVAHDAARHQS